MRQAPAIFAVLLLLLATGAARAANISWINPAGGSFNEAANWDTHTVPTGADNVFITLDGTYTVRLDANTEIGGLSLGGAAGRQTLDLNSFTLTVATPYVTNPNGFVPPANGKISAPGRTIAGEESWTGGTYSGTTTILPGGRLNISASTDPKNLEGTINNSGLITWSNNVNDFIFGRGENTQRAINNLAGGTFNSLGSATIANTLQNVVFNNSGTVNALSGTLELFGNGVPYGTNTRAFNTAQDAFIKISGINDAAYTLGSGASFGGIGAGVGTIRIAADALLVDAPVAVLRGTVEFTRGNIAGSSALTMNAGTLFTWTAGTISSTLNIAAGARLQPLVGNKSLSGTINNSGLLTWNTNISDTISADGDNTPQTLNNLVGGVIDSLSPATVVHTLDEVVFNNRGTVNARSGTLRLFANDKPFGTNTRIFNVAAGAVLEFAGINDSTYTLGAGAIFTGAGTHRLSADNLLFNAPVSLAATGTLELSGGTTTGPGTLTIASGASLNWKSGTIANTVAVAPGARLNISRGIKSLQGTLNNGGMATWTATTADDIDGAGEESPRTFNNLASGVLANTAGTVNTMDGLVFNNAGTVNALRGTLRLYANDIPFGTSRRAFNASSGAVIEFAGTNEGNSYTLSTGTTLSGAGQFRITDSKVIILGSVPLASRLNVPSGEITGSGALSVSSGGVLNLSGGTITNTGALNVALGGILNWTGGEMKTGEEVSALSSTTIARGGVLNVSGTAGKALGRRITNSGTANFAGAGIIDGFDGQGASITNALGGVLNTQRGTTTFSDINVVNAGTINLGGTGFGALVINGDGAQEGGDFSQTVSGVLNIQIGGVAPGVVDRIVVGNRALLGGAVASTLVGSFLPTATAPISFVTYQERAGGFVRLTPPTLAGGRVLRFNYTNTAAQLVVSIAPIITGFTPPSAAAGTDVTVTGVNFSDLNTVRIGTLSVVFARVSATSIRFKVPVNAVTGAITVINPAGSAISRTRLLVLPSVRAFSPASGPVATSVLITGANLADVSAVKFGSTSATFTRISSTQVRASVPAGATTGRISVTTPGGTALSATVFTVTPPPSIRAS